MKKTLCLRCRLAPGAKIGDFWSILNEDLSFLPSILDCFMSTKQFLIYSKCDQDMTCFLYVHGN